MDKLLSLCMIVKNEEKVLRRCLNSVQGLVDEIIVVDTGSEDSTVEIAKSFTDHVYHFNWIHDFSAAKNDAIRRATSKWILVLDADEYVDPEQHEEIRSMLAKLDSSIPKGFTVPIYNYTHSIKSTKFVESTALRLFPNHREVCFERAIHEQVMYHSSELPSVSYHMVIFHTGYTQEAWAEKKKTERNLELFEKLREKKHFEEYDYFTLGNEYNALEDFKKALYYYKKALTKRSQTQSFYSFCYNQAAICLIQLDWLKEAAEFIEQGLVNWPQYADYYCLKALVCERIGLYDEAIELFEKSIHIANNPPHSDGRYWIVTPTYGNTIPLTNLHRLYARKLDHAKTVYYLTKLIQLNSGDQIVLYQLLTLLIQHEPMEKILDLLNNIYSESSDEQLLQLLNISLLLGHQDLTTHYYNLCQSRSIPLLPHHILYIAVITSNKPLFDEMLLRRQESDHIAQINKLLLLASIIWQEPKYGDYLAASEQEDLPIETLRGIHYSMFEGNPSDAESDVPFDINYVNTLLIDLFKMQSYDSYDWLIQKYPIYYYVLANLMGDHFYGQGRIELALDYYSLLLSEDQLGAIGYSNIAFLYCTQGNVEEGIEFLQKSLERNPAQANLYPLFFRHSRNKEERQKMLRLFRREYPQYSSMTLMNHVIKDQA